MLRNTVNSEALMTAFHQSQPGANGNKVAESDSSAQVKLSFEEKVAANI